MLQSPPAQPGMREDEIDTPALIVDLDAFEYNLDHLVAHGRGAAFQVADIGAGLGHDQRAAFADGAFVLRAALVGLQSAKYHMLGRRDALRQRHRFGSGVDPCPARADVDLHQDR